MTKKINLPNFKTGLILMSIIGTLAFTNKDYISEIKVYQEELNDSYLDREKSPL